MADSLQDILARRTTPVAEEGNATDFVETTPETAPETPAAPPPVDPNPADFAPESSVEEPAVELTIEPEEIADLGVSAMELVVDHGLPWLNEIAAFSRDERSQLRAIAQREKRRKNAGITVVYDAKGMPDGFSARDLELLQRFDECEEYRENVSLTPEESAKLKKHLKAAIKGANVKLSPKGAAWGAIFLILGPRLLPIGGSLFDRLRRSPDDDGEA